MSDRQAKFARARAKRAEYIRERSNVSQKSNTEPEQQEQLRENSQAELRRKREEAKQERLARARAKQAEFRRKREEAKQERLARARAKQAEFRRKREEAMRNANMNALSQKSSIIDSILPKETIEPKFSKTYQEFFNLSAAKWILQNRKRLEPAILKYSKERVKNGEDKIDLDPAFYQLNNYVNSARPFGYHGLGFVMVKYCRPDNIAYGRRFCYKSVGLQSMKRLFRSALQDGIAWDIDMVNCHPAILIQLCNKHNIDAPLLAQYVNDRNAIFKQEEGNLITRTQLKTAILTIINNGKLRAHLARQSRFLRDLEQEIKNIRPQIIELHPQIRDDCFEKARRERRSNIEGMTISRIMCNVEDKLLAAIQSYFVSKKFKLDVSNATFHPHSRVSLQFDGFVITYPIEHYKSGRRVYHTPRSDFLDIDKIIIECEEYIMERTDYVMKLAIKDFDEYKKVFALPKGFIF